MAVTVSSFPPNSSAKEKAGGSARRFARLAGLPIAAILACSAPGARADAPPLRIIPLTTVQPSGSGYLADPQPIHLTGPLAEKIQLVSGTTHAVIACAFPIRARCFLWAPITVDTGSLAAQIAAAGATVTNIQNVNAFQADDGSWHAAVTIGIKSAAHPQYWTVVAHAHPTTATMPGTLPAGFAADTLLSGSLLTPAEGNYDAKYYQDGDRLFLLFVRNYVAEPKLRNEIVLQAMRTPTVKAAGDAVVLLRPGDRYGPLNSETYADTEAKLVEAPFITRFGNKVALVYSTGAYLTAGYKAGVAWSDSLIPVAGQTYRKVLQPDPTGIWQTPSGVEVRYLVQSEEPAWPNDTLPQVVAPGVASAIVAPQGQAWLLFNGFAPGDMESNGQVEASHRRPFAIRLSVSVPQAISVAAATDAELSHWLEPAP